MLSEDKRSHSRSGQTSSPSLYLSGSWWATRICQGIIAARTRPLQLLSSHCFSAMQAECLLSSVCGPRPSAVCLVVQGQAKERLIHRRSGPVVVHPPVLTDIQPRPPGVGRGKTPHELQVECSRYPCSQSTANSFPLRICPASQTPGRKQALRSPLSLGVQRRRWLISRPAIGRQPPGLICRFTHISANLRPALASRMQSRVQKEQSVWWMASCFHLCAVLGLTKHEWPNWRD